MKSREEMIQSRICALEEQAERERAELARGPEHMQKYLLVYRVDTKSIGDDGKERLITSWGHTFAAKLTEAHNRCKIKAGEVTTDDKIKVISVWCSEWRERGSSPWLVWGTESSEKDRVAKAMLDSWRAECLTSLKEPKQPTVVTTRQMGGSKPRVRVPIPPKEPEKPAYQGPFSVQKAPSAK